MGMSSAEFAEKVHEVMPAILEEVLRQQTEEYYKIKITLPQLMVLEVVAGQTEVKMSHMAKVLNVSTAAMTGIVDRMVKGGYLVRESDDDDRRIIKVRPTAKGSKIVKSAREQKKAILAKIFEPIPEKDREEYLRILTVVKENLYKNKV